MKKIKRDTLILLSTFWCVGLIIIFFKSMNRMRRIVPKEWMLPIFIGILIFSIVILLVLILYVRQGWLEFKQTKQASFWKFLWTDSTIIEEDERSIKISEHALKKSNEYTEVMTILLLFLLLLSGIHSITTSWLIFALLCIFTVKTLSYYFLSKKGYYA